VTAALQADELGNIFEILTENVLVSPGQHGHAARAESQELLLTRWIVQHIDGNEVDALLRKKLFRSKAAASAGLSEQNERISDIFHKNSSELRKILQHLSISETTRACKISFEVMLDFRSQQEAASHHRPATTDLIKPL
jgi:hypothetical protein